MIKSLEKSQSTNGGRRILAPAKEPAGEVGIQEEPRSKRVIQLRVTNYVFVILALMLTLAVIAFNTRISSGYRRLEEANVRYVSAEHAAMDLETGSDYLTESVRSFVVTGNLRYLEDYFEEAQITRRRDRAVEKLEELLLADDSGAFSRLVAALETSNALMEREYLAMRFTQTVNGIPDSAVPKEISSIPLSPEQLALSPEEKKATAEALVFGDKYMSYKESIWKNVDSCAEQLIESSANAVIETRNNMNHVLHAQTILLMALILAVLTEVIFITIQVRIPLTRMVKLMRSQEKVPPKGAAELCFVTQTYNEILEENQRSHQRLSYEVSHDPLTGLYNRNAYELFMERVGEDHIALLIIDVDEFKTINDSYGHDIGDKVLKRVAEILTQSFRSVDAVCRFGGDEFVVVMTRVNSSMRQLVINKISRANQLLQNPKDGLPKVSISVGVAFSDRENPEGNIFQDADTALYRVKEAGRCGCEVFGSAQQNNKQSGGKLTSGSDQ